MTRRATFRRIGSGRDLLRYRLSGKVLPERTGQRRSAKPRRGTREQIACCAFGNVELAAALHRNLHERKIAASQYQVLLQQLAADEAGRLWKWLPLRKELIRKTSAIFAKLDAAIYLRAADALHLVYAAENGFKEIYTNDKHLLAATGTANVEVRNVIGGES